MSATAIGATPRRRRRDDTARLPPHELLGIAMQGLRTRKLRAALSALGIAIGIGAMVAVVGVSSSSQANLLATIDALGTNLLDRRPRDDVLRRKRGPSGHLGPDDRTHAERRERRRDLPGAERRCASDPVCAVGGDGRHRSRRLGRQPARGRWNHDGVGPLLGSVADRYPEVVLGAQTASILQITHAGGHVMVYLGNRWFNVIGIMKPAILDPTLDTTAFISLPVAEQLFQLPPNPSEIYVRANVNDVDQVSNLLAATADPQNASGVEVSRPSDILEARAAAKGQFTTLLLGLGAVALLVGAIGIANIMVISVLERRGEIGLRRSLGATRRHISIQFLTESAVLAAFGGVAGLILGAGATEVYALAQNEPFVVPLYALIAAPAAGFVIGMLAGLYPAAKAARLSPTEALRA